MAVLGLQGVRGGVGTTSITAALGWALHVLGESVLVIDACPDNLLRLSFNVDFDREEGWARAMLDNRDWREGGMRYTSSLDILPFGRLTAAEWENTHVLHDALGQLIPVFQTLQSQQRYNWVLVDLPHGVSPLTRQFLDHCDHTLVVVKPDTNCHVRLHQQPLPVGARILVNDLRIGSQMQDDLYQVWLQSQRHLLPMVIHRDEAMVECLGSKQPLGEYRGDALAAEEILTLANWCLLHCATPRTPEGQSLQGQP